LLHYCGEIKFPTLGYFVKSLLDHKRIPRYCHLIKFWTTYWSCFSTFCTRKLHTCFFSVVYDPDASEMPKIFKSFVPKWNTCWFVNHGKAREFVLEFQGYLELNIDLCRESMALELATLLQRKQCVSPVCLSPSTIWSRMGTNRYRALFITIFCATASFEDI